MVHLVMNDNWKFPTSNWEKRDFENSKLDFLIKIQNFRNRTGWSLLASYLLGELVHML